MPIPWDTCDSTCFTADFCVRAVVRNGDAALTGQYEFSLGGTAGQYAWNQTGGLIDSGFVNVLLEAGQGGGTGLTLTLDTSQVGGDGRTYGDIVKVVLEAAVTSSSLKFTWSGVVATFYNASGAGSPTDAISFHVPVKGANTLRWVAAAPTGSVRVRVQGQVELVQSASGSLGLNALAGRLYVYTTSCTPPA